LAVSRDVAAVFLFDRQYQMMQIDKSRLWRDLQQMGEVGATVTGGVRRLALSVEDKAGRDLFVGWCRDSGYQVRIDSMGNIYARRKGANEGAAPVVTGSHLDSQPVAGKYDGPYGVLAGLEALRTLDRHNVVTERPIDVVVWTNEEGARFQPPSIAAAVVAGSISPETALASVDSDGVTFGDALRSIGYAGSIDPVRPNMHCYIEAHIEQGPILEGANLDIGVVNGVVGVHAYEVELTGQSAHTGTTPIHYRKDALLGAAHIIEGVRQLARRYEPKGRASVAFLKVSPNARSVIAEKIVLTADCRNTDEVELERMRDELLQVFAESAAQEGLEVSFRNYWSVTPTQFSESCVEAVRRSASDLGYTHENIYSGAGHDAMHIARLAPSAMIFIPCKDGLSHHEAESITVDQAAAGANVLLHTLVELAGTP
jgi:beta-ureidopropionase / N-carbamoyl-L-amino-acid hydrolase